MSAKYEGRVMNLLCPKCGSSRSLSFEFQSVTSVIVTDGKVTTMEAGGVLGGHPDRVHCGDCSYSVEPDDALGQALVDATTTATGFTDDGFVLWKENPRPKEPVPTITISLEIENTYELYDDVTTHVTDEEVPAPPTLDPDDERYKDWAETHIRDFTGTGRTEGDSWYDVTVTACSEPALVGRTFEWGY